ncbi:hypothetical protein GCM10010357_55460 [Streptomyces luteireticuli]|uniref:FtsK domain-containing protein n=1 Tax=Streptomyces luteireticuli TaxID=173858 RepID=A0ABP3IVZ1_9ACTN
MGRRGVSRTLSDRTGSGRERLPHGREFARSVTDGARDVLHPVITVARGWRSLAAAGRRGWARTPREQRGAALLLAASCVLIVALVPYGPPLAAAALLAAGAWRGRDRAQEPTGRQDPLAARLQSLYEALVPYFSSPLDPAPLYRHGGGWREAFDDHGFDREGRLVTLRLRYPAYFTDGESDARARVEHLLRIRAGRDREYRFAWDEEEGTLEVTALAALPAGIGAQRFVTAPGETVLGFTDPGTVRRTLPVTDGERTHDVPPVVWRTGRQSTEPHLLVLGTPAAGVTTLLRSVLLQALPHGDAVVVDGGGTGEFSCLSGREGVLAAESGLPGCLAALDWAEQETQRRLVATNTARQQGRPAPEDVRRALWIVVDRPAALGELAARQGLADPQELLQVPLRHGRAANVTVVVGEQLENARLLAEAVLAHTRARAVLGPVPVERVRAVLGGAPDTTPVEDVPPGRGWARVGTGPVHRLQVPATPDPYDEGAPDAQRRAVLALLPEWPPSVAVAPAPDGSGHEGPGCVDGDGGAGGHQAGGLGEARHRLVGDGCGDGEGQPYVPLEGPVDPEPRSGRHAYPQPLADLGDARAGEPAGAHPQGEPAARDAELPVREAPFEGIHDGVPADADLVAAYGDGGVPAAAVQQPGDGELFEHGRAEVGVGAGGHEAADHLGGGAHPADAQPGPEGLAGRAHGGHGAAGGVEGADRAGHLQPGFQHEVGHGLVGDEYGAGGPGRLDEFAALSLGGEGAGGVVEVGDHVGQAWGGVPQDLAPGGQVPACEPVGHPDGHEPGAGLAHQLKDIGVRR